MSEPTHRQISTGRYVFPEGIDPADLEELAPGEWEALELGRIETELHGLVDRAAGVFRTRFITEIAGQQLTYDRKEREAREFLAATSPVDSDYVFLSAEATATDTAIADLATEVVANADMWAQLGAAIEGRRIGAKRAITLAKEADGTAEERIAAMRAAAAVDWEALAP